MKAQAAARLSVRVAWLTGSLGAVALAGLAGFLLAGLRFWVKASPEQAGAYRFVRNPNLYGSIPDAAALDWLQQSGAPSLPSRCPALAIIATRRHRRTVRLSQGTGSSGARRIGEERDTKRTTSLTKCAAVSMAVGASSSVGARAVRGS
jgi:hypothetical protein